MIFRPRERADVQTVPDRPRTGPPPKVSVIIATYCSGSGIDRVMASLDRQTMPQDDFEVILVDDGSPDDTFQHLKQIARARDNVRIFQIPNSGWPSKPRNVGIEHARGEYLTFMDHDDALYPDGLLAAYRYAVETKADIVSPKESKTNDSFWQMNPPVWSNVPNLAADPGIALLIPLVPHKLYARHLFTDHHIRFPEGRRVLWEDQFINIEAYRHAKVVALEAQTPFYLWYGSDTNTSHTFRPDRQDFWDRLADLIEFVDKTLPADQFTRSHDFLMLHHLRSRVIDRTLSVINKSDGKAAGLVAKNAQKLLRRFLTDDLRRQLPLKHRIQALLLGEGKVDLARKFHRYDRSMSITVESTDVDWSDTRLQVTVDARLAPNGASGGFRREAGRVMMNVPADVRRAVPDELLDVSDVRDDMECRMLVRARGDSYTSWHVRTHTVATDFETVKDVVVPVWRGLAELDLVTGAAGNPLPEQVYDVRSVVDFAGMKRKPKVGYSGPVKPALIDGRAGVAYPSASQTLALDLHQHTRTLAIDAWPGRGSAGSTDRFSARLRRIHVHGRESLPAPNVVAIPVAGIVDGRSPEDLLEQLQSAGHRLDVAITTDGTVASLEGRAALPAGLYWLYARRSGKLNRTVRQLLVGPDGAISVV